MSNGYGSLPFVAKAGPKTIGKLAGRLFNLLRRRCELFVEIEDMVRLEDDERWKKIEARAEYRKRRDEHARKVLRDERLQKFDAGPPEKGWSHEYMTLFNDGDPVKVDGWFPPGLASEDEPAAPWPLVPLMRRELTKCERYTVLAAIYNAGTRGWPRINPWKDKTSTSAGCEHVDDVSEVKAIGTSKRFAEMETCIVNATKIEAIHLQILLDNFFYDLRF